MWAWMDINNNRYDNSQPVTSTRKGIDVSMQSTNTTKTVTYTLLENKERNMYEHK